MYEDMIRVAPFSFCDFEVEATSYLEEPRLKKLQGDEISYECKIKNFNATENKVTNETDTKCDDSMPTTP